MNGTRIHLRASAAMDEGIVVLGNLLEAKGKIAKYDNGTYGNIHNRGHIILANHSVPKGAMIRPATSMRDPIFFQWHQFIEDTFKIWKASLPSYTEQDLRFPGLYVTDGEVLSDGYQTKNFLHTFTELAHIRVPGISFKSETTELQISYDKLNHGNFQYRFSVYLYSRQHDKVQANVRIFLIPKTEITKSQPIAILLDKYRVNLKKRMEHCEKTRH